MMWCTRGKKDSLEVRLVELSMSHTRGPLPGPYVCHLVRSTPLSSHPIVRWEQDSHLISFVLDISISGPRGGPEEVEGASPDVAHHAAPAANSFRFGKPAPILRDSSYFYGRGSLLVGVDGARIVFCAAACALLCWTWSATN